MSDCIMEESSHPPRKAHRKPPKKTRCEDQQGSAKERMKNGNEESRTPSPARQSGISTPQSPGAALELGLPSHHHCPKRNCPTPPEPQAEILQHSGLNPGLPIVGMETPPSCSPEMMLMIPPFDYSTETRDLQSLGPISSSRSTIGSAFPSAQSVI